MKGAGGPAEGEGGRGGRRGVSMSGKRVRWPCTSAESKNLKGSVP